MSTATRTVAAAFLTLALSSVAACGDDGRMTTDGGPDDSGLAPDGSTPDAGDAGDAGEAGDAGPDTGSPLDGSTAALCTDFESATSLGNAESGALDEVSGIAVSYGNPGVLWAHNDSGDSARVFALGTDGGHLGQYALTGASHVDWEDMTLGPGPAAGTDYLYLGDTGDNAARDGRGGRASIVVYRVAEPPVDAGQAPVAEDIGPVEALSFVYPDAPHDCESLMIDRETQDLYFLTKDNTGLSGLYVARAPLAADATVTLERVGEFMFGAPGVPGGPLATGGDFAPDGSSWLIRTYSSVLMFPRAPGATWASTLLAAPVSLAAASERQGEAIAWTPDGHGYYTVSEYPAPAINFYAAAASCSP